MGVFNHPHNLTGIVYRSIPTIAFPSGSARRIYQVSINRDLDGNTVPIDRPIPVIACPAGSIKSVCKEPVLRHLDGIAGFIHGSIPALTLPPFARKIQVGMRRDINGQTGTVVLPKTPTALPPVPIG
jgi:hypothetical protein